MYFIRTRLNLIVLSLGLLLQAGCATSPENASSDSLVQSSQNLTAESLTSSHPIPSQVVVPPEVQQKFDEALAFLQAGNLQEAETRLDALNEISPNSPGIYTNLAIINERKGKKDQAIEYYRMALSVNAAQPVAANNLANLLIEEGKFSEADQLFRSAFGFAKEHPVLLLNSAINNELYLHNKTEALVLYQKYLTLTGTDESTLLSRVAMLQRELGQQ